MLFVCFTNEADRLIESYERPSFAKVVVEDRTGCSGDFRLFNQKDELLYSGTFTFGTDRTCPNLHHQVKNRAQRVWTKKEDVDVIINEADTKVCLQTKNGSGFEIHSRFLVLTFLPASLGSCRESTINRAVRNE